MYQDPLYIQVIKDIVDKIEEGVFEGDSFLPSEQELMKQYAMSRTTIRRAVSELINQGYLTVIRGVGTKIVPSQLNVRSQELMSFTQMMQRHGVEPGTASLNIKTDCSTPEIEAILNTKEIICIERVRTADKTPISINISYLPERLLKEPGKDTSVFRKHTSLYAILENELNTTVYITEDTMSAIKADATLAKRIQVRKNDPILLIHRKAYDTKHNIIEYSIIYLRADRYRYTVTLRRK